MLATKGTVLAITAVLIVLALSISVYQGGQPAILTRYSTSQRAPNKNVAWGREKDVPSHDLTVFTVSTSISPELQFLISSSPYNVNVLGMGDKFEKYRSKALLLLQAIRPLTDDHIILYIDAVDAAFFHCGRDMVQQFLLLDSDIVFQTDDFDWPDVKDEAKGNLFPDPPAGAPQHFRYLCAGAWMGRVGAVKYFFSRHFLSTGAIDQRDWDDQRWWRNLYLAQLYGSRSGSAHVPKLSLDFQGLLFQMFRPYATYLRDRKTGAVSCPSLYKHATACIIHAEGPKKPHKKLFYSLLDVYLHSNDSVLHKGEG